jgi:large conductance mechanosensitive channel
MSGFKNFVMRGNLVELAVAVVIGTQFSGLVKQFVSSFVNPLLSLVGGMPNFANLTFKVGQAVFSYGQFVTAVLSFVISALVVYFILVLPVSRLLQLLERNKAATTRDCPECTMSIPVAARRCPQCTAEITAATERPQPVRLAQPAGHPGVLARGGLTAFHLGRAGLRARMARHRDGLALRFRVDLRLSPSRSRSSARVCHIFARSRVSPRLSASCPASAKERSAS